MRRLQAPASVIAITAGLALGGGLLAPAAGAAATPATLACSGSWSIVSSPNVSSANDALNGVAIVSLKNAWAVGVSTSTTTSVASTLTEHWNGTRWRIVPSPNAGSAQNLLQAVAVIPDTHQLWAVGYSINSGGPQQTLIERWNGTSWNVVPSPNAGTGDNSLGAVVALSAADAWAVGTNAGQTLIEHWDGTSWSIATSPPVTGNLLGLTAVPGTSELWTSGGVGSSGTLTEHFDGTSWSVVPSPGGANAFLYGIGALAASDVWAVGSSSSTTSLTEHWDGTTWSVVPSPNPSATEDILFTVARIPGTIQLWAVGLEGSPSPGSFQTLVERWDGTSWTVVASPNPSPYQDSLRTVGARGSQAWAVGSSTTTAGITSTLIEHFC